MKKRIIAIMGEAGSGKDFLVEKLIKNKELFHKIIPCTTRPLRENEIDDVQYHFISVNEFQQYASSKHDYIIDQTCFNGWYYGTKNSDLSNDKINIGVFNPSGVNQIINNSNFDVKVVQLKVEPVKRMQRQLYRESNPNVSEIARRFLTDEKDFQNFHFKKIIELPNNSLSDFENNINIIKNIAYNWDNTN